MSDDRAERLRAYVEATKGKPVNWGVDDCSPWAAQWVADLTGRDIDWPVYSSEEEVVRIIEEAGSLLALWEPVTRSLGLQPIIALGDEPRLGDVGIVESSRGQVGGIFAAAGSFCWRAARGVRILPAWGFTYPLRTDGKWQQRPIVVKAWRV